MPITTDRIARSFADLHPSEWSVVGYKPYDAQMVWEYTMDGRDVVAFHRALSGGELPVVQQSDGNRGWVLLAKLPRVRQRLRLVA